MVRTFQLTKVLSQADRHREHAARRAPGRAARACWQAMFAPLLARTGEAPTPTRADDLLERFKLDAKREDFAGSLSGGQRKLLEMARALMVEPELVMLDEPMAGVNPALKQSLLGHVKSLRDEGRTVLFVEHDMDMVRDISDWVIVMAQGKIVAEGPPDTVMADPRVIDAYLGAHHDTELTFEAEEQILAEAEAEIEPRRRTSDDRRSHRAPRSATRPPRGGRGRGAPRRRPDRRLPARRQHPQRRRPLLPGGRAGRHHRSQRRRQVDAAQGALRPGQDQRRARAAARATTSPTSAPTCWSPPASASSRRPTTCSPR